MILIKTKDDLFNYNNALLINFFSDLEYEDSYIYTIHLIDNNNYFYDLYKSENKDIAKKVYNEIQNKIIESNDDNESRCIDVETIIKEVENGNSF